MDKMKRPPDGGLFIFRSMMLLQYQNCFVAQHIKMIDQLNTIDAAREMTWDSNELIDECALDIDILTIHLSSIAVEDQDTIIAWLKIVHRYSHLSAWTNGAW